MNSVDHALQDKSIISSPWVKLPEQGSWRLIIDDAHGAAWNMAVDEAILDAVEAGISPPTLRLYRWDGVAITIGKYQKLNSGINLSVCTFENVPVVRRITGGRAILHDNDQGISIISSLKSLGSEGEGVGRSYRLLSQGYVCGLKRYSVTTSPGSGKKLLLDSADCFACKTEADLVDSEGIKLLGCAQKRTGTAVLEQCSLRHEPPFISPERLFSGEISVSLYPLEEIEEESLQTAIIEGFEEALGIKLMPGFLSGWEEERACVLRNNYSPLIVKADAHL